MNKPLQVETTAESTNNYTNEPLRKKNLQDKRLISKIKNEYPNHFLCTLGSGAGAFAADFAWPPGKSRKEEWNSSRFCWVFMSFAGFLWVLLGFYGFCWVSMGFARFLLGFYLFLWVSSDFWANFQRPSVLGVLFANIQTVRKLHSNHRVQTPAVRPIASRVAETQKPEPILHELLQKLLNLYYPLHL